MAPRRDYHTSRPEIAAAYTGQGNELALPAEQPPSLVDEHAHTKQTRVECNMLVSRDIKSRLKKWEMHNPKGRVCSL